MKGTKIKSKKILLNKSINFHPLFITLIILIIGFLLIYFAGNLLGLNSFDPDSTGRMINQSFLVERIIINSIASFLILIIINSYISIYLKTKSNFSLGLLIMSISLLIQTLSANPLILSLFSFRLVGLGLLSLVSSATTLIAVLALLYLSRT
ncbi:MAG: hypothetical protein PHY04_00790 [Candidatus ainarchaeum sp.]|jgi:hypothetical protein|nr:hypothetical protein [Candidatus ainarchaeum sp.]MDD3085962.1 hypothetical protein [Candidatus ainarchaeum sp.]MDD4128254.1 hypothetical protein [Candidatus ainarchaeum sp.]MDD4467867.1 hypothetical protein [Candidatus ainarchaeum sp.]HPM85714.1 hypothetical protein [archaeon]